MLSWLSSRFEDTSKASDLYGAVVAQARTPAFYAECGIEDTAEGRFETIVLHLVLVLERLAAEAEPGAKLAQQLVETFVRDMDDSMREMGVGDMGVAKRVKRAAAGLYERRAAYVPAMHESAASLARALGAQVPGLAASGEASDTLAGYMSAAARQLAVIPAQELLSGQISFPAIDASALNRIAGGVR